MHEPTLPAGDILVSGERALTFVLRVFISISTHHSPGRSVARLCLLAALAPHPGSSWPFLVRAAAHFVEGTQAPEKPVGRERAKTAEPGVRVEAGAPGRWETGNANLEMKGVGL